MTLTKSLNSIGGRCRSFFDSALPKGAKVKSLQGILGLSHASAERIAAGQTPTTAHLVALADHFGRRFVDYIFADVVERPSSGELAEVEAIRRALDEQAMVASAPAEALAMVEKAVRLRPSPSAEDRRASGLVVVRRPLACLADVGCSHLKDRLSRFTSRVHGLERAIDLAKADPLKRTGIAVRDGSSWRLAYIAKANGLTSQAMTGRRLADLPDPHYVQTLSRSFEEAAASPEPIITDSAGAVLAAKGEVVLTNARIARAVVGNVLMACFAPMAQRQATG